MADAPGDDPSDDPQQWGTPEGRRVLRLLWEPPEDASRGPKPKTTRDEVVRAGIAVADAEGLAALSIRKVAAELGLGTMSVYTYVPGRSELVELMIDAIFAELDLTPTGAGWRTRLERWCREQWGLYRRHPWLLDHAMIRLPLAPHVLASDEELYAALWAAGFDGPRSASLANVVRWQLLGAARSTISDLDEERRTGVSAEAYWEARSSFWVTYFDAERFPTMFAIWESGAFDDPETNEFEPLLDRLLDGIAGSRDA